MIYIVFYDIHSMCSGTSPDPGPTLASAYVPGTPGADWTDEEVHVTRMRILQACFFSHPFAIKTNVMSSCSIYQGCPP